MDNEQSRQAAELWADVYGIAERWLDGRLTLEQACAEIAKAGVSHLSRQECERWLRNLKRSDPLAQDDSGAERLARDGEPSASARLALD